LPVIPPSLEMHARRFFIVSTLLLPLDYARAEATVTASDKLPEASIELHSGAAPTTPTPWRLPRPGDAHYDADKEALTKDFEHTHVVHVFDRGVFTGYTTVTKGPLPKENAQEQHSQFIANSKLPADAVELAASEHPDKSEYFPTKPEKTPANVPANCILVRVFQDKILVGWTYMPEEAVALLHRPNKE